MVYGRRLQGYYWHIKFAGFWSLAGFSFCSVQPSLTVYYLSSYGLFLLLCCPDWHICIKHNNSNRPNMFRWCLSNVNICMTVGIKTSRLTLMHICKTILKGNQLG